MPGSHRSLPGVKHKVIGLLSGGKDSCFNLLHCIANGHELVAVATLQPEIGVDELDSHLYQSVGTRLLPYIAQSLSLPLYTGTIRGKAVARGPEYGSRLRGGEGSGEDGDETEDLKLLLDDVLDSHPEATALASGAILSNYQRLRIEHVCARLGLLSLSYLWQQPQLPLLDSMIRRGVEAVLIKVAGVGLGIDVVGKDLREVRPLLARLEREYGSHPAGEGGEYETLTLSTPLFSHRLRITKSSVIVTDPEPYPVGYLQVDEVELEGKPGWVRPGEEELREMLDLDMGADGLDQLGREHLETLGRIEFSREGIDQDDMPEAPEAESSTSVRFSRQRRWFAASVDGRTLEDEDIGEEIRHCLESITTRLEQEGLSLPLHTAHVTLLISTMSDFVPANVVYTTYFGTSPPSRATVAVPLSPGQRVKLEVIGFDDRPSVLGKRLLGGRQALHVQSLSYWAPANIGPYSQAVNVNERVHLAGQIPLLPASLTLPLPPPDPESPYVHQAVLALQHVRKIIEAMRSKQSTGGGWTGWGEGCVVWYTRPDRCGHEGLDAARKAWSKWMVDNGFSKAVVIFLRAEELPRGALVEYQCNLHTGRTGCRDDDDDDDDDEEDGLEPSYVSGGTHNSAAGWEISEVLGYKKGSKVVKGSRVVVFGYDMDMFIETLEKERIGDLMERTVAVKVYHLPFVPQNLLDSIAPALRRGNDSPCMTYIPVLEISDRGSRMADVGLEAFGG